MFNILNVSIRRTVGRFSLKSVSILGLFLSLSYLVYFSNVGAATQAIAPVFSKSNASVTTILSTNITLSSGTSGAQIYYSYKNGSVPSNPVPGASGTYLYDGSKGLDLQVNGWTTEEFKVGTYYVKAIAVKSGYTNSNVTQSYFVVTNRDQSSRDTLNSKNILVNKDSCWIFSHHKNCTSLLGMKSATLTEVQSIALACDAWNRKGTGTTNNACKIYVTGGTEDGHESGTCSHSNGYKFDAGKTDKNGSTSLLGNFITTTGTTYFTYQGKRSDGYPMYKRNTNGNIYTDEGTHWDVVVPNGTSC